MADIKQIWGRGMKQLNEVFQHQIGKITAEFEIKTQEYESMSKQLIANHEHISVLTSQMKGKFENAKNQVLEERRAWEVEKDHIASLVKLDSEIVPLNVGGTHHLMTERDVLRLCPGSILEKMFNGMHSLKKVDDEVFLDRDGTTFQHLVNYLRNNQEVFPEFMDRNEEKHFYKELEFWQIPLKTKSPSHNHTHVHTLRGSSLDVSFKSSARNRSGVRSPKKQLQQPTPMMMTAETVCEKGVANKEAMDKWHELGPLLLEEIVRNSEIPIDQSRAFGQSAFNQHIIGQVGSNGKVSGVGKEINHIIYEGQFQDDIYNGYGRFIYGNGNYYLGYWLDGKRNGYGKLVDTNGRIYEGTWQNSKFLR